MPLTTYVAGDVLTAASLNANFTFAASNPPGGLELIVTQIIGTAVSSVNFTNVFSSTYDNYKICYFHTSSSNATSIIAQLGTGTATTTNYNGYITTSVVSWGTFATTSVDVTNGMFLAFTHGLTNFGGMDLYCPNLARPTYSGGNYATTTNGGFTASRQSDSTAFTSLHVSASTGTITGGAISVYGYAK